MLCLKVFGQIRYKNYDTQEYVLLFQTWGTMEIVKSDGCPCGQGQVGGVAQGQDRANEVDRRSNVGPIDTESADESQPQFAAD